MGRVSPKPGQDINLPEIEALAKQEDASLLPGTGTGKHESYCRI